MLKRFKDALNNFWKYTVFELEDIIECKLSMGISAHFGAPDLEPKVDVIDASDNGIELRSSFFGQVLCYLGGIADTLFEHSV